MKMDKLAERVVLMIFLLIGVGIGTLVFNSTERLADAFPYEYFITYKAWDGDAVTWGDLTHYSTTKIRNTKDVDRIKKLAKGSGGYEGAIIINIMSLGRSYRGFGKWWLNEGLNEPELDDARLIKITCVHGKTATRTLGEVDTGAVSTGCCHVVLESCKKKKGDK